jgi:hypothetical protein
MWISQPYDLVRSGRETSTSYDTHTVLPPGQGLKVHFLSSTCSDVRYPMLVILPGLIVRRFR